MSDLIDSPKHSDLIYDVGMHRGEDTEFYLKKGFRVIAFEANPDLILHCRNRFKDYLDKGQLIIVEGAITGPEAVSANGKVTFYRSESGSPWGTVCDDWSARNQDLGNSVTKIEVDCVNFEEVIREHGIPHYLKIDIEGCDLICLEALKKFSRKPDCLSFESDKTCFGKLTGEIELLVELGYQRFQAVEQTRIPATHVPPVPSTEGSYASHQFEPGSSGLFGAELPGSWKSKKQILRLYRFVFAGYRLLGDFGVMYQWQFPGASSLRRIVKKGLGWFTHAEVPGWYDTHAALEETTVAEAGGTTK